MKNIRKDADIIKKLRMILLCICLLLSPKIYAQQGEASDLQEQSEQEVNNDSTEPEESLEIEIVPEALEIPDLTSLIQQAIVIHINDAQGYVNGKILDIDSENKSITPLLKNGTTIVPIRFFA